MKTTLSAVLITSALVLSPLVVSAPASARAAVVVDFGNIGVGYRDGYRDHSNQYHRWAHRSDYTNYRAHYSQNYRDMNHDRDHNWNPNH